MEIFRTFGGSFLYKLDFVSRITPFLLFFCILFLSRRKPKQLNKLTDTCKLYNFKYTFIKKSVQFSIFQCNRSTVHFFPMKLHSVIHKHRTLVLCTQFLFFFFNTVYWKSFLKPKSSLNAKLCSTGGKPYISIQSPKIKCLP